VRDIQPRSSGLVELASQRGAEASGGAGVALTCQMRN